MAQVKFLSWTNANPVVARDEEIGFIPTEVYIVDLTNGVAYYWNEGFDDDSYQTVSSGVITAGNGVTPLATDLSIFGGFITNFTNANPGVITATHLNRFNFAVGDTIKVAELVDDQTGATLNGTYTVAAVTATTITTATDTTNHSVYVDHGQVTRVSDVNGVAIPIENKAFYGLSFGTAIGGAAAEMTAVARGDEPVV